MAPWRNIIIICLATFVCGHAVSSNEDIPVNELAKCPPLIQRSGASGSSLRDALRWSDAPDGGPAKRARSVSKRRFNISELQGDAQAQMFPDETSRPRWSPASSKWYSLVFLETVGIKATDAKTGRGFWEYNNEAGERVYEILQPVGHDGQYGYVVGPEWFDVKSRETNGRRPPLRMRGSGLLTRLWDPSIFVIYAGVKTLRANRKLVGTAQHIDYIKFVGEWIDTVEGEKGGEQEGSPDEIDYLAHIQNSDGDAGVEPPWELYELANDAGRNRAAANQKVGSAMLKMKEIGLWYSLPGKEYLKGDELKDMTRSEVQSVYGFSKRYNERQSRLDEAAAIKAKDKLPTLWNELASFSQRFHASFRECMRALLERSDAQFAPEQRQ